MTSGIVSISDVRKKCCTYLPSHVPDEVESFMALDRICSRKGLVLVSASGVACHSCGTFFHCGENVYWLTRANCRRAEKYGDIR